MTPTADFTDILKIVFEARAKRLHSLDEIQKEQERIRSAERYRRKFYSYFPDEGPLRRELYPQHMLFFDAGSTYRERAFIAGNRVGKSDAGSFELTAHLTGEYPHWWTGRSFDHPIKAWAAGSTNTTVRDILQAKLIGRMKKSLIRGQDDLVIGIGTGMIPGSAIINTRPQSGIPDAVESVYVRHSTGGTSILNFKSYQSGRTAFEGTEQDVIWLDEECDQDIYTECLVRTMTNDGLIMLTMTPLLGLSQVILSFMPGGAYPQGGIVNG